MADNQNIKCPKCGHNFPIEEVLTKQIEKDYEKKYQDFVDSKESEYVDKDAKLKELAKDIKKKQVNIDAEVEARTNKSRIEIEKSAVAKASKDYEDRFLALNQENEDKTNRLRKLSKAEAENAKLKRDIKSQADEIKAELEKDFNSQIDQAREDEKEKTAAAVRAKTAKEFETRLKAAQEEREEQNEKIEKMQETELENERLKRALDGKEREVELKYEKKLNSELSVKTEEIRLSESEKHELILKDSKEKNNSLIRKIDELQQRAEQGSMQSQGETMELLLEESLCEMFPTDLIEEVSKGVNGADVIQTVINSSGIKCGKIVYESKRTKAYKQEWLPKLKSDTVAIKGDVSVLVTQTMPKGVDKIGMVDGVWICSLYDYKGTARLLRDQLIKIASHNDAQKNKGDKIANLYDYMTSIEFKLQLESILTGYRVLVADHEKEKKAIKKLWSKREKQFEAILDSTYSFIGSIQGIAGSSIPQLNEIDNAGNLLEE
ncbi:MAG: DUF2130 domain-containing protein [Chlorobi bacterium]|nr:DUF2130 domain-containing protein [Chlorobiota bacterium]